MEHIDEAIEKIKQNCNINKTQCKLQSDQICTLEIKLDNLTESRKTDKTDKHYLEERILTLEGQFAKLNSKTSFRAQNISSNITDSFNNLKQENMELKMENQKLKTKLAEVEVKLQSVMAKLPRPQNQSVVIPTHNRFDILSDDTNCEEETSAEIGQETEVKKSDNIHFIMDSHGN